MSDVYFAYYSWFAIFLGKCVKISSKNSMESGTESSSPSHRPPVFLTPAAKKCNRVSGERRSLQEWLIHLLALKPCRKHDLIQRLEKSNMFPRDHTELLSALDEVWIYTCLLYPFYKKNPGLDSGFLNSGSFQVRPSITPLLFRTYICDSAKGFYSIQKQAVFNPVFLDTFTLTANLGRHSNNLLAQCKRGIINNY